MNLSGQITEAHDHTRAPLSFNRQEATLAPAPSAGGNAKISMKTPSNIPIIQRAEPSREVDDLARKVIGALRALAVNEKPTDKETTT